MRTHHMGTRTQRLTICARRRPRAPAGSRHTQRGHRDLGNMHYNHNNNNRLYNNNTYNNNNNTL